MCIPLGDSNISFLKRSDNCECKSILELLGFKQLIRTPARIINDTESLIDIIASNNCASIKDTAAVDHEFIGCVRKLNHMKLPEKTITCRNYRPYHPSILSEHLCEVDWNLIYHCNYIDFAWIIFKDILSTVFNKFAPVITKRVPWLSAKIKSLMNIRDKLIQKARKSKVNAHREESNKNAIR